MRRVSKKPPVKIALQHTRTQPYIDRVDKSPLRMYFGLVLSEARRYDKAPYWPSPEVDLLRRMLHSQVWDARHITTDNLFAPSRKTAHQNAPEIQDRVAYLLAYLSVNSIRTTDAYSKLCFAVPVLDNIPPGVPDFHTAVRAAQQIANLNKEGLRRKLEDAFMKNQFNHRKEELIAELLSQAQLLCGRDIMTDSEL